MTPIISNLEIAEAFEKAADDVFTFGWVQGVFGEPGTPRCMDGHLIAACTKSTCSAPHEVYDIDDGRGDTFETALYYAARHVLSTHLNGSIWGFNDCGDRTAFEVRDAFLFAAKELRNSAQ